MATKKFSKNSFDFWARTAHTSQKVLPLKWWVLFLKLVKFNNAHSLLILIIIMGRHNFIRNLPYTIKKIIFVKFNVRIWKLFGNLNHATFIIVLVLEFCLEHVIVDRFMIKKTNSISVISLKNDGTNFEVECFLFEKYHQLMYLP